MEHTHHATTHGPGSEAALRWLARQLRWEHLLSELRAPVRDDEAGPTRQ
ncbi:MAG: hypothetical protein JWP02_2426 [Acidimicrobiales bacterium]|nr:hypothetical protein [Acidimicrobiales bacterium]